MKTNRVEAFSDGVIAIIITMIFDAARSMPRGGRRASLSLAERGNQLAKHATA